MKLHHEMLGSGPPLIVLHGLLGSLANWRSIGRALADLRTVVLTDLRSHGRSPHSDELTLPAMAADVRELIDAAGFASADILGHSLGGKVAMQLALDEPARVRSLTVLDISPRRSAEVATQPLRACLELDLRTAAGREDVVRELHARLGDEALARWLAMNLQRKADGGLEWRIPLKSIERARPQLGAAVVGTTYSGPALFLRGARSSFVGEEDQQEIRRMFPASRIETIEHAGHWLHHEAMEEVVGKIRDFLS